MSASSPSGDPSARAARPGTPRWVKVFGIIGLLLVVLVILLLTGVLGKGHGPGRHLGRMHGTNADSGRAETADRTILVTALDTMAFAPSRIDVSAGETIAFDVTNAGTAVHEFTLGDAAMQRAHGQMMGHMPAGMGHDTSNSITLQPGETKRITWRFGGAGTLEYACHQQGHYRAGMRGQIRIS